MSLALDALRQNPAFWTGREERETLPTGFAALDGLLPGGGWPVGALTEVLSAREGIGELRLLMPVLAKVTCQGRLGVWVSPPHVPYGPALVACGVDLSRVLVVCPPAPRDGLWAAEQALGSGACGIVLAWVAESKSRFCPLPGGRGTRPSADLDRSLRRLQLAAERGKGLAVLWRPFQDAERPSPAALRLSAEPAKDGLAVRVLKGRGPGRGVVLGREEFLMAGGANPVLRFESPRPSVPAS